MLNIRELEERHTKYKIKYFLPYLIIIIIAVGLFIVAIQMFNSKPAQTIIIKKTIVEKIPDLNSSMAKKEIIEKKEPAKQIEEIPRKENTKKVLLSPSLNFMRRVNTPIDLSTEEKNIVQHKEKKVKKPKAKSKKIKEETIVEEIITIPLVEEEVIPLKIEKKSTIKIKINKDQEDIQHVIKRFKVNNNPALSLFVAKKYYQLGDYHKSYNYALITNQLNNNIEASWIIFSKSLMKLDKKEMAINTLKKYIDDSHSPRAKILLDEIQSGKFK